MYLWMTMKCIENFSHQKLWTVNTFDSYSNALITTNPYSMELYLINSVRVLECLLKTRLISLLYTSSVDAPKVNWLYSIKHWMLIFGCLTLGI